MAEQRLSEASETSVRSEPRGALSRRASSVHRNAQFLCDLQHTIGNRAVQRLIQTKLQISAPADIHEQEADRVARHVVSMPSTAEESMPERQGAVEEKDKGQVQIGTLSNSVQSDSNTGVQLEADDEIEQQLDRTAGNGSPLSDHVRNFMEPRFGADFSEVRIHTGHDASQMSEALSAQAFTVGRDIYYGPGKSPSDLELTAHELTHVVQQGGCARPEPGNPGDSTAKKSGREPTIGVAAPSPTPRQGLARRIINRRGVPLPIGATIVPTPEGQPDGSKVVAKLNEMAAGMWSDFKGFDGTMVDKQIVNAIETNALQPRDISINFPDERGVNMNWTGTVKIRMENPTLDESRSGTGTLGGAGGGTGTYETETSTSSSSKASGEVPVEGGKVGAEVSTTTTQSEKQGGSGTATTSTSATHRLQTYNCTIIADIFLQCEPDFSGTDYINPFKWGFAGAAALSGLQRARDSVEVGRVAYMVSGGKAGS